jgi:hypothetical protein
MKDIMIPAVATLLALIVLSLEQSIFMLIDGIS